MNFLNSTFSSPMTQEQNRRLKAFLLTLMISSIYAIFVLSLQSVCAGGEDATAATSSSTTASGYMTWLTPFDNFVDACVSFVTLVGKAMLLWAFFETGTALYSHDVSQVPQALRRIGAGCMLVFIKPILDAMVS